MTDAATNRYSLKVGEVCPIWADLYAVWGSHVLSSVYRSMAVDWCSVAARLRCACRGRRLSENIGTPNERFQWPIQRGRGLEGASAACTKSGNVTQPGVSEPDAGL